MPRDSLRYLWGESSNSGSSLHDDKLRMSLLDTRWRDGRSFILLSCPRSYAGLPNGVYARVQSNELLPFLICSLQRIAMLPRPAQWLKRDESPASVQIERLEDENLQQGLGHFYKRGPFSFHFFHGQLHFLLPGGRTHDMSWTTDWTDLLASSPGLPASFGGHASLHVIAE